MITAIVAVSSNGIVGSGKGLPWKSKADLAFFKRFTMGGDLVMGSRTSLPLLGRRVHTLSLKQQGPGIVHDPAALVASMPDLIVAGGPKTYLSFKPWTQAAVVTRLRAEAEGDVLFPEDMLEFLPIHIVAGEHPDGEIHVYASSGNAMDLACGRVEMALAPWAR